MTTRRTRISRRLVRVPARGTCPPLGGSFQRRRKFGSDIVRVLVGVGVRHEGEAAIAVDPIRVDTLYRGLLALPVTHLAVVHAIAESLDAVEMLRFGAREGWLLPRKPWKTSDVVDLDEYAPRGPGGSEQMLHFVPLLAGTHIEDLENLTRTWLEIAMLDAGARDFETALVNQTRPYWAVATLPQST